MRFIGRQRKAPRAPTQPLTASAHCVRASRPTVCGVGERVVCRDSRRGYLIDICILLRACIDGVFYTRLHR